MANEKKNETSGGGKSDSAASSGAPDRMAAARNARRGGRGFSLDRDLTAIEKSAIAKLRSIRADAKLAIDAINRGEVDAGASLSPIADALAAVARVV